MSASDILDFVFAGFVVLLLGMIFFNVLGGPRHRRRRRASAQRWNEAGDSSGGVDPGPLVRPRGKSSRWDGGGDNGADNGGDGGGDGGGGGD